MKDLVKDTWVFRGPEIGSDHFLVASELRLQTKWKKFKSTYHNNKEVYKVYLCKKNVSDSLYQDRLQDCLTNTLTKENINEEWENIQICTEKSATKALGKKMKFLRRKGLQILNEEIENDYGQKTSQP